MRRLIINADDLGISTDVNHGIFDSMVRGVVTSATRMANGAAFEDANRVPAELVRQGQAVSFGCHVVLVDGSPVSDAEKIPTLLDNRSNPSQFRTSLGEFALSAALGRLDATQIQAEVEAQIRKIQDAGRSVSHVDTHKHVHMFPSVLRSVLRAARNCGVRAVRNPFEPSHPVSFSTVLSQPRHWKRYAEVKALRMFAGRFRDAVEAEGMVSTDGTLGIMITGALAYLSPSQSHNLFCQVLDVMPEGTWEFCCHPGFNLGELDRIRTRLKRSRLAERNLLVSPATREAIATRGIELISYWDLQ